MASGLLRGTDDGLAFRHELAREAIVAAIARAPAAAAPRPHPGRVGGRPRGIPRPGAAGPPRRSGRQPRGDLTTPSPPPSKPPGCTPSPTRPTSTPARCASADRLRAAARAFARYYLSARGGALAARHRPRPLARTGRPLREGDSLRWLSRIHWFEGHGAEAGRRRRRARTARTPSPQARNWRWPTAISPNCGCSPTTSTAPCSGGTRRSRWPKRSGRQKSSSALASVGALDVGDERGDAQLRKVCAWPSTTGSPTTPGGR